MSGALLLIVRTACRRYAVRRDDLTEMRMLDVEAALPPDEHRRPYITFDLGALLDPADQSALRRRRALIVPLRRKNVVLLVDYVESFHEHAQTLPLPAIMQGRLERHWAVGVLLIDEQPIIQLDLREVARSALQTQVSAQTL